ncbi:hypothetical protein MMC19_004420 [Ptychographa xylographoides]|nr:hypothetical protein [Ptychographa xylographoides]
MSETTSRLKPQHQASSSRRIHYPLNLNFMSFDVAAELTAPTASVYDEWSALKTSESLWPGATIFGSSHPIQWNHSDQHLMGTRPSSPTNIILTQDTPSATLPQWLPHETINQAAKGNSRSATWPGPSTLPDEAVRDTSVPSTYGSFIDDFTPRHLVLFTPDMKDHFGNLTVSVQDTSHNLLSVLTREFADVLDHIHDVIQAEERLRLEAFDTLAGNRYKRGEGYQAGAPILLGCRPQYQDSEWMLSILRQLYNRRWSVIQHINNLRYSTDPNTTGKTIYPHPKPGQGPKPSPRFEDYLKQEQAEWERLWEIVNIECESARLVEEQMGTLAKLWGGRIPFPEVSLF